MVFLVHSPKTLYRSEQLRIFNSKTIPDLEAFAKLGFPLKQTVKVKLTERQQKSQAAGEKDSNGSNGETVEAKG